MRLLCAVLIIGFSSIAWEGEPPSVLLLKTKYYLYMPAKIVMDGYDQTIARIGAEVRWLIADGDPDRDGNVFYYIEEMAEYMQLNSSYCKGIELPAPLERARLHFTSNDESFSIPVDVRPPREARVLLEMYYTYSSEIVSDDSAYKHYATCYY